MSVVELVKQATLPTFIRGLYNCLEPDHVFSNCYVA